MPIAEQQSRNTSASSNSGRVYKPHPHTAADARRRSVATTADAARCTQASGLIKHAVRRSGAQALLKAALNEFPTPLSPRRFSSIAEKRVERSYGKRGRSARIEAAIIGRTRASRRRSARRDDRIRASGEPRFGSPIEAAHSARSIAATTTATAAETRKRMFVRWRDGKRQPVNLLDSSQGRKCHPPRAAI